MIENKIHELKSYITGEVTRFLLDESKQLFNEHPEMTSFGWHQFMNEWSRDRYIQFEESLERPDISGALGEHIFTRHITYPLQQKVAEFLKPFDKNLLQSAFGNGVDITIYNDRTIEVIGDINYDTDRPMVIEL